MSGSGIQREPVEELAEEFARRLRRGERPSLTEYIERHPALADEIRELFPALVVMEKFGSVAGLTGPRPPGSADGARSRLGDFRILREVGRGGMGIVYEAIQESLGRHVALKVLAGPRASGTYLERFRREAKAAARLHHTNIVPVFGVGEADGTHFYAMQFICGHGLDVVLDEVRRLRAGRSTTTAESRTTAAAPVARRFANGDLSPAPAGVVQTDGTSYPAPATDRRLIVVSEVILVSQSEARYYREAARLCAQAADALHYAHAQGILHRDVKPSNLLLDAQGTLWITDFGLAKAEDSNDLTDSDDLVGTIRYMAPERFRGQADARSDVYALGMTLYELLTLRPAYDDSDRLRLVDRVATETPVSPRGIDPRIPPDLETIVLKAAARDPADRYATAGALADDLCRFLADRPILARRHSRAEQLWRWGRRNPQIAGMLGFVAALFVAVGVVGIALAYQFRELALRANQARQDAEHNATELRQSIERQNRAYQLLESGHAHIARRDFPKAIHDLTEAASLRPDIHSVWDARSDCYGILRLYESAASDLTRAFALHKSPEASVWYMRSALNLYTHDRTGYRDTCAAMVEHFGRSWGPRNCWWQAEACTLGAGAGVDPEFVVGLAQRATDEDAASASYALTLAAAHYRAGRPAEALATINRIATLSGSKAGFEAEPLLAMVHFQCGHEVEARRWLSKTHDRCVALAGAMTERPLEYRYALGGDYDLLKFLLQCREARGLIGGCPATNELVGEILHVRSYTFLGDLPRAEAHLKMLLNNHRNDRLAWLFSGSYWAQRGTWVRALADYEKASSFGEFEGLSDLCSLAVLQLTQGHSGASATTCGKILNRYGRTDDSQEAADAVLYCALGTPSNDDAVLLIQLADRSLRSKPDNAWSLLAAGAAHYRAGNYQHAMTYLRRAVEARWPEPISPEAGRALAQLFQSLALFRLGETAEAKRLQGAAAPLVADRIKRNGGGNLGRDWYVWAAGQILSREAEASIGPVLSH